MLKWVEQDRKMIREEKKEDFFFFFKERERENKIHDSRRIMNQHNGERAKGRMREEK